MRFHRHQWFTVFFRHTPFGTIFVNQCRRCRERRPGFWPRQGLLP